MTYSIDNRTLTEVYHYTPEAASGYVSNNITRMTTSIYFIVTEIKKKKIYNAESIL